MCAKPLISLIVPVYNVAQYLAECAESIRRQDFNDFEVLLVDDGSTDGSASMCDDIAASDSRFRVIHQSNGGTSVARNAGIEASSGDYIAFMDSDDIVHPAYLSRLFQLISEYEADIAMVKFAEGRQIDSSRMMLSGRSTELLSGIEALERTLYQDGLDTTPCCKLYRRSVFDHVRFVPGLLYEDLDLITKVLPMIGKVVVSDDILYFYRHRKGSNIGSFSMKRLDVLDVTRDICHRTVKYGKPMQLAARDRRLSAAFNMFVLLNRNGYGDTVASDGCWDIICDLRGGELSNSKVRLKNKIGVFLSYGGKRFFSVVSKVLG